MAGHKQTEILSVHKTRWRARRLERDLTEWLGAYRSGMPPNRLVVPIWVKGFRVRPAGRWGPKRQFVVEATSWKGR